MDGRVLRIMAPNARRFVNQNIKSLRHICWARHCSEYWLSGRASITYCLTKWNTMQEYLQYISSPNML